MITWMLYYKRIGDLKQMQALSSILNLAAEVKPLHFTDRIWPLSLMAPNLDSLPGLEGPAPDLVICAGSRTSRVAVAMKRRSGGTLKIICVGRPKGDFDIFDLIITTPQYNSAAAANVLEIPLPLTLSSPAEAGKSAPRGQKQIALLVGGESLPMLFNTAIAEQIAGDVAAYARDKNASIVGTSSIRTGAEITDRITQHLPKTAQFHVWGTTATNPYAQILREADEFIVTSDSISMTADALATGKPVSIYPLPEHWRWTDSAIKRLWETARQRPASLTAKILWPLFNSGALEVKPDRRLIFDRLAQLGAVSWFGGPPALVDKDLMKSSEVMVVDRVRRVLNVSSPCP